VSRVDFPADYHIESLSRSHPRRAFDCGLDEVNDWLATGALQSQRKHLSVTRVLLDAAGAIAGYYTLATGQVDFGDLPPELAHPLPRRMLPVAVLAWLGVNRDHQHQRLGSRLLAQALNDCLDAGATFPFVAVILDSLDDRSRDFYRKWGFAELPGHPYRLYLGIDHLQAIAASSDGTSDLPS
jgi:GNAT superfamily N-acetyltransferase